MYISDSLGSLELQSANAGEGEDSSTDLRRSSAAGVAGGFCDFEPWMALSNGICHTGF